MNKDKDIDWQDENFEQLMDKFCSDTSKNKPDFDTYCMQEYVDYEASIGDALLDGAKYE